MVKVTNLDYLMILIQFPHALEDENEGHSRQDQREDNEDHHDVCLSQD